MAVASNIAVANALLSMVEYVFEREKVAGVVTVADYLEWVVQREHFLATAGLREISILPGMGREMKRLADSGESARLERLLELARQHHSTYVARTTEPARAPHEEEAVEYSVGVG